MKNIPQRERPGRRSRSSYNRKGKRACVYEPWSAGYARDTQQAIGLHHLSFFGTTRFCPFDPNYAYKYTEAET